MKECDANDFKIEESDIKELIDKLCDLGESMNIEPDKFAVMLTMAAKYMADLLDMEVIATRNLDA